MPQNSEFFHNTESCRSPKVKNAKKTWENGTQWNRKSDK